MARRFAQLGFAASHDDGYCVNYRQSDLEDQNVVALHPPKDASCGWVVLGAHYDALGTDARGVLYPGADDNASGTAVMLEVARRIREGDLAPKVGVAFVAFGGEEKDLAGSRAFVRAPAVPLSQVQLMINVDMAGRKPAGYPIVGYEVYGKNMPRVGHQVRMAAAASKVRAVPAQLGDRSDSASFAPHVPTVFFCTMVHADYHEATDLPARVDLDQTERVLGLVSALLQQLPCEKRP
ncbi:MAG: M20/M25/M40 family metallo-hydrolase [Polyangiaceae bacterium]